MLLRPLAVIAVIVAIAVGLTVLFWGPLWQGHGLIGGDLYTYFFPQKVVFAEQLADGRLPLWNDRVGFGYPMLAESQTGVFYPSNQILYRLFDVNTAYNVSQLGHYVLAFVFTWLLMRRLDLSASAATLAGIVFVYGWFPPRICLEWAIIGGVYFPLSLWCVESYLQTRRRHWLFILALAQGLHLLAGHFNLAFITQLTCCAYAALRVWLPAPSSDTFSPRARSAVPLFVAVALLGGFALAAVQVLPTWELKQLSQREDIGGPHDPGYGHIPPWYLSQIAAPFLWYPLDVDPDQALTSIRAFSIPSLTNKVEAHLYFGIVPLLLILYRLGIAWLREPLDRRHRHWFWLGLAAMVYTTGWLLPITRHLPGFSFFMGPGRYGIVTTLAAALLAGAGLDCLVHRLRFRSLLIGLICGLAVADLYWVSRRITYAVMVVDPPILHIEESEVRRLLTDYESSHGSAKRVRLLAPGANLATLTGFPAMPPYLGIGPSQYYDPELTMPEPTEEMSPEERRAARSAQREWLRQASITHVLSMEPLDMAEWPATTLVWKGFDRLLNAAWGRREPLFLYELTDAIPRFRTSVSTKEAADSSKHRHSIDVQPGEAGAITVHAEVDRPSDLIWADLAYPGWVANVTTAEKSWTVETADGLFRHVPIEAGEHDIAWGYRPKSHLVGAVISLLSLAVLCLLSVLEVVRRRRLTPGD